MIPDLATPVSKADKTPAWRMAATGLALAALAPLVACGTPAPRPGPVARGDVEAVTRQVQALVQHEMREQKLAGLSIALVSDQRVVWAQGFGWADAKAKQPATPQTLYRVGSISKLFTATAVMQLVEQGRLKLDEPVQQVLPEFNPRSRFADSRRITPRQLLSHHAGLPRDITRGMWTAAPSRYTEVTAALAQQEAPYPPDTVFSYSNLGFDVLGHAVERVAGRDFEAHLRQAVLAPLGMADSSFTAAPPRGPQMAQAHKKGEPVAEPALRDVPAGGLNASVLDLSRFLSMLFAQGRTAGGDTLLRPQTVSQMLAPQNDGVPLDVGFRNGLGWMLSTLGPRTIQGAGPVAHHGGSTINFRSQMYALPEHKLGVVVLSNDAAAERVVDRIAVRALSLLLQAQTGIQQPEAAKPVEATQPWPAEALKAFEGDYTTAFGHVRVQLRGSRLKAQAFGETFSLQPLEGGGLGLRYAFLGLFPVSLDELDFISVSLRRVAGREVLVASSAGQDWLVGEKIKPGFALDNPARYAGRYEFVNRPADDLFQGEVRVEAVRGFYLVHVKDRGSSGGQAAMPLLPVSANEAVMTGVLSDGGPVVRPKLVNGQLQIEFSGYLLRRAGD